MAFERKVEPYGDLQPLCIHLRSKGMCVSGELDIAPDAHDGHCWCNLTQHVYGPSDQ